ncbi:MAG TPA: GHMP kinase, partial [Cryomorphaceae bacterium]|nr:GHMP kinase [Cryomorphaceae bacterium]
KDALTQGKLDDFGSILHKNWLLKQSLASGITNQRINNFYATALDAGALGGKLLGAGGGGFMLFYVPVHKQFAVDEAMQTLDAEPFNFNMETLGSQI